MAVRLSYDDIAAKVSKQKPINYNVQQEVSESEDGGTTTITDIPELQPVDFPMDDLSYSSTFVTGSGTRDVSQLLSITPNGEAGFINSFSNKSQAIVNSDRVVINAKQDYLFLFGESGVSISSKNPVNIDSDTSFTVAATDGIFLGVPNNGKPFDSDNQKQLLGALTKGGPTKDQPYEPVPLGIKLANLLEDLLVVLKNARIITPMGLAYFREDTQYDFANLQARIPEILSSVVFVDGISHEPTDPAPKPPATSASTNTNPGTTTQPTPVISANTLPTGSTTAPTGSTGLSSGGDSQLSNLINK